MSVRRSLVWAYGTQVINFAATFGTTIVLARLLSPRDFGVYAMAMAVWGIIAIFTGFSVTSYLVRERDLTQETVRAAFSANALLAVLLSLLLAAVSFAPPSLLEHDVALILRVMALNPLIGMLEFVPVSLAAREMRFSFIWQVVVVRTVLQSAATIALAHAGYGAMSFALAGVIGYVASAAIYNVARPRDIMLRPTSRGLKPVIVFGMQVLSTAGVAQGAGRLADLLLGRFQGLAALGMYSRASGITSQVHSTLYGMASGVLFSKLSEDLRTTGELHQTYLRAISILTAIMWPASIGVAVLARPFVAHVYGDKWLEAAMPLTFLMVAQFVTMGFAMNWELFVLREETGRQAKFEAVRAVVGTIIFAGGASISITFAAAARVLEAVFGYLLYRPHMDRMAGTRPGELERVYLRSAVLTVAAVAPSLALMLWSDWSAETSVLLMVVAVATGGACWAALLVRQHHPLVEEAVILLDKVGWRRRPVVADHPGS